MFNDRRFLGDLIRFLSALTSVRYSLFVTLAGHGIDIQRIKHISLHGQGQMVVGVCSPLPWTEKKNSSILSKFLEFLFCFCFCLYKMKMLKIEKGLGDGWGTLIQERNKN